MPNHFGFKKIIGEKIEVKRCAVGGNKKTLPVRPGVQSLSHCNVVKGSGDTERPASQNTGIQRAGGGPTALSAAFLV